MYIGAFAFHFIGGDSNLGVRVAWALIWGTLTWPFFLGPQILVQWLVRKLLGRWLNASYLKQLFILNVPVVVLAGALVGYQYTASSPRSMFERLVMKPIPESVRAIEQGSSRRMDSVFLVLQFEISRPDIERLLTSQKFGPVNEGEEFRRWDQKVNSGVPIQKEEYLKRWQQKIREQAKLNVNLTRDWQACTLKERGGRKYIFFNTNSTEAVFVAEAH